MTTGLAEATGRTGVPGLARSRWVGLAGAGLLAGSGYLAGAMPGAAPESRVEALWGTGPGFRVGLVAWLAGLVLLGWAWWRLRDASPPVRWVLVTGALWAAPLLLAPPLGSRDLYAYACQGAVWLDGYDPYTVGVAAGGCPWLDAVPMVWQDTTTPYGPLALLVSAGAVALARAVASAEATQLLVAISGLRVVAMAGGVLVAGFGPRLARACGVSPAAAGWLGLATPLVLVHVVSGGHHDALVAGLVVAAFALAAPSRSPGWRSPARLGAGVALGLAVAVKVTALAAAPFVLLLAASAASGGSAGSAGSAGPGGYRRYGGAAVAAAGGVASFAGLTLATGLGTGWAAALDCAGAIGQWTAPPTGLGMAAGYVLWGMGAPEAYSTAVAVAQGAGVVALAGVSLALVVRAWRRVDDPRVVVASGGAVLAAAVLLGPVLYPWYAVLPLAVLAACVADRRARTWLAVATLVLTVLMLPSGLGVAVLTRFPGAVLMVVLVVLAGRAWLRRAGRRAGRDPDRPRAPARPSSRL